MSSYELLEKKVAQLIAMVQTLKKENASLTKENADFKKTLSRLENDVLQGSENVQALKTEKEKTKVFISDLIKNIDQLVESGSKS